MCKTACLHFSSGTHWDSCHWFFFLVWNEESQVCPAAAEGQCSAGSITPWQLPPATCAQILISLNGTVRTVWHCPECPSSHLLAEPPSCISSPSKFWYYLVERGVNYFLGVVVFLLLYLYFFKFYWDTNATDSKEFIIKGMPINIFKAELLSEKQWIFSLLSHFNRCST